MFGLFKRKKEVEKVREETKKGFENVKKDISSVSGWIRHLDSEKNIQKKDIEEVKKDISTIKDELEGLKNTISFMNEMQSNRVFSTPKQAFKKQTGVQAVETGVQTGVQTPNFENFSVTERAILWVLLNSEMKLSYEDLAAMLGKEKTTIRGQINRIKQKSESLVKEKIENNGKKRVYIPEDMKEKMLKKSKVRVSNDKKKKKKQEVSEY